MRFVGWDLSDPFARRPRPVDVAEVDAQGRVCFDARPWPAVDASGGFDPGALVAAFPVEPEDVVVVDGPQALARPGASVREAERLLRTPGRTPDVLPVPGAPFCGFVRGSVLLFAALRQGGALPMLDGDTPQVGRARLLEAYPGATWRRLAVEKLGRKPAVEKLGKKDSPRGRAQRQELLEEEGLRFPAGELPTHDQLDAALCAWLGWLTRTNPERVHAVGTPLWMDGEGGLREGRILDLRGHMKSMMPTLRAVALWLPVVLLTGLMGGCFSGAHTTASRPPESSPPLYLAQASCWDTVSCCVQRNPLTAVQSCGADPARVASILKTFESLYATTHPGEKAAAETDMADAEQAEDWSSIADLPEWKQRCIKFYYACRNKGWTGKCDDCLRYCEGQQDWPLRTCRPRKE